MRKNKPRGATLMKANGYHEVKVWLSPSQLKEIDAACDQAGYARARLLRAGGLQLAETIRSAKTPSHASTKCAGKARKAKG